jgi:NitT/TauT family transport system substrate-binding protein
MKKHRWMLAALVMLGLAAGAQAQEKIRLGILPFSESLGAVIADKEGYFKAEGLEVEMSNVGSGAQGVPLLQSGRIDIVFSNTVTTLQAMEQGLDATIVAPGAVVRAQAPDTTTALMVLKGSARSPKDREGKRVSVNVINSTARL